MTSSWSYRGSSENCGQAGIAGVHATVDIREGFPEEVGEGLGLVRQFTQKEKGLTEVPSRRKQLCHY